jgi:hypothetical protein
MVMPSFAAILLSACSKKLRGTGSLIPVEKILCRPWKAQTYSSTEKNRLFASELNLQEMNWIVLRRRDQFRRINRRKWRIHFFWKLIFLSRSAVRIFSQKVQIFFWFFIFISSTAEKCLQFRNNVQLTRRIFGPTELLFSSQVGKGGLPRQPIFKLNLKPVFNLASRVARFLLEQDTKTGKIYQMTTKYTEWS